MNVNMGRVVDIVGAALILGLILRYGREFALVVTAGGSQLTSFYNAVALAGTRGTPIPEG